MLYKKIFLIFFKNSDTLPILFFFFILINYYCLGFEAKARTSITIMRSFDQTGSKNHKVSTSSSRGIKTYRTNSKNFGNRRT